MGVATFSDALPGIRGSSIVDLGIACASPTVPHTPFGLLLLSGEA